MMEKGLRVSAPFSGYCGKSYQEILKLAHRLLQPRNYVEIGVFKGDTLSLVKPGTFSLGIDPAPQVSKELSQRAELYELTSDAFFEEHDLRKQLGGQDVDLAFVDGNHLFEYAYRDLVNLERYSGPSTLIIFHDVLPLSPEDAGREWPEGRDRWLGDAWKMLYCLHSCRPDLHMSIVPSPPTGLLFVDKLDSANTVLADNQEQIIDTFLDLDFTYYAQNLWQLSSLFTNAEEVLAGHKFADHG